MEPPTSSVQVPFEAAAEEEEEEASNMRNPPVVDNDDDEDENDWTFQEFPEASSNLPQQQQQQQQFQITPFPPPQLHPAVSMGMHKVSSCYFSIGSHESMNDLLLSSGNKDETYKSCSDFNLAEDHHDNEVDNRSIQFDSACSSSSQSQDDILYHDILMNVFTYLDASSLASFSETARRPNFEVFYFLQLQLQRSLLVEVSPPPSSSPSSLRSSSQPLHSGNTATEDPLTAIAGSAILSRLAKLDPNRAQAIVDDYLQSNSTLRRMPLSHSIAYMRHYFFLQRHHHHHHHHENGGEANAMSSPQALASAALLATVVGAAYMTGGDMESTAAEIPNLLFRFGFVGSLMGAAATSNNNNNNNNNNNKTREEKKEEEDTMAPTTTTTTSTTPQFRFPSLFEMKETLTATLRDGNNNNRSNKSSLKTNNKELKPMLSNPYDHHEDEKVQEEEEEKMDVEDEKEPQHQQSRKMPSGCMGAYSRAIQASTASIVEIVKHGRQTRFAALNTLQQARKVATLLEACSLNDGLSMVQELSATMDLDAFYVGSDGSETCALHTAAFHGAHLVVDYLLQGIDDDEAAAKEDGGLCLVDCPDSNGWTALHFAAGSNSVECVKVLAKHGAKLSLEANNGYSPLQWARRLSNNQVEETLTELLQQDYNSTRQGWRTQPLTSLANRFFSLIPSR